MENVGLLFFFDGLVVKTYPVLLPFENHKFLANGINGLYLSCKIAGPSEQSKQVLTHFFEICYLGTSFPKHFSSFREILLRKLILPTQF